MSTEYDIIATKGNNLNLRFLASNLDGTPTDLTQYAASGFVRLHYSSTGILLDLHPTIHPSYISGFIDISVPAADLTSLPITQALYDIKIYHITGCNSEVVHGYFDIQPAATI